MKFEQQRSLCCHVQYWKMDRSIYERGEPPFFTQLTPEFCFGHWSTQCRSAFQVPVSH